MESLLIKERYKVIYVLYAEEDYAALQAVDIQSREKTSYLLNVYEGDLLKPYLRAFHELRGCGAYRDMFLWENSLVTVFDLREGTGFDRVFFRGAKLDWKLRMQTAQTLFHEALAMSDFPPQISCGAFLTENIQVIQEEKRIVMNYAIRPLPEMNRRELVFLLTDQIRKVLLLRWDSPRSERRFVRQLCRGEETSPVAVYRQWTLAQPEIQADYERIQKKAALARWLYLLFMNLRDWAEVHIKNRKRKGGGRG